MPDEFTTFSGTDVRIYEKGLFQLNGRHLQGAAHCQTDSEEPEKCLAQVPEELYHYHNLPAWGMDLTNLVGAAVVSGSVQLPMPRFLRTTENWYPSSKPAIDGCRYGACFLALDVPDGSQLVRCELKCQDGLKDSESSSLARIAKGNPWRDSTRHNIDLDFASSSNSSSNSEGSRPMDLTSSGVAKWSLSKHNEGARTATATTAVTATTATTAEQGWQGEAFFRVSRTASKKFIAVSAGDKETCALLSTGEVECFHSSTRWSRTGKWWQFWKWQKQPKVIHRVKPRVTFSSLNSLRIGPYCYGEDPNSVATPSLSARDGDTCGLTSRGKVLCWKPREDQSKVPLDPFKHIHSTLISISNGRNHACGVTTKGGIVCVVFESYWESSESYWEGENNIEIS